MQSYADSPALYASLDKVLLAPQGGVPSRGRRMRIATSRPHKDRLLVTFKGVDDRDAAEALRGLELYVPMSDLPPLDEDELWLLELPGVEVRLADGRVLGPIVRVDTPSGQEIWVIDVNGRELLFPAVPQFVMDMDMENGVAVIDPPPGLLDLYLSEPAPEQDQA